MEDLKFKPLVLDSTYEYFEVAISVEQKKFLSESAKKVKLQLPISDKEQYYLVQASQLMNSLEEEGWDFYEKVEVFVKPELENSYEVRRFRRKKSTSSG